MSCGNRISADVGGQVSQAEICKSFGGTAVDGDVVYVPCADGLRAVRIGNDGAMTVLWHADGDIAGSPVIGGGRIWSVNQSSGTLHALDPATGRSTVQVSVGRCQPVRHASAVRRPGARADARRTRDRLDPVRGAAGAQELFSTDRQTGPMRVRRPIVPAHGDRRRLHQQYQILRAGRVAARDRVG